MHWTADHRDIISILASIGTLLVLACPNEVVRFQS